MKFSGSVRPPETVPHFLCSSSAFGHSKKGPTHQYIQRSIHLENLHLFLPAYCFYNARIYSTILPMVVIHSVFKTLTPHREFRQSKRQSQIQSLRAWLMAGCTCLLAASWQKQLCPLLTLLGCSEPAQCITRIPMVERLTAWGGVLKNLGEWLQKSRLDFWDLWVFIYFFFS